MQPLERNDKVALIEMANDAKHRGAEEPARRNNHQPKSARGNRAMRRKQASIDRSRKVSRQHAP